MAFMSFEDLEVWKKGCRLAVRTFEVFDRCKRFGLRDQITRSGLSIPSNIAEGCERNSVGDFVRFLNIANGSAAEFRTQLYIAHELNYLNEETFKEMLGEVKDIAAMLFGLVRSIKERSK